MSVLTDPTDAAFANATEALVPPGRALIPAFDTSEDSASCFQSMPASLDSGHQQVATSVARRELAGGCHPFGSQGYLR